MKLKFLPTLFLVLSHPVRAEPGFATENYQLQEIGPISTIAMFLQGLEGKWSGNVQGAGVRDGKPYVALEGEVRVNVSVESPRVWLQSEEACFQQDKNCQTTLTRFLVLPLQSSPNPSRPKSAVVLETSFTALSFAFFTQDNVGKTVSNLSIEDVTEDGKMLTRHKYVRSSGEALNSELLVLHRN